jgi:hypothetical protein
MLDGKVGRADGSALVVIERVLRGVIYGLAEPEFIADASRTLEFFINGILIGSVTIQPSDFEDDAPFAFKCLVSPRFIFEAPISLRMRDAESGVEVGHPMSFLDAAGAKRAIEVADGAVTGVEYGALKGVLRDVNPHALPIALCVYHRGAAIARVVVDSENRPSAAGAVIPSLPFSMALPSSVLDGSATTLCVRIEGAAQDFAGSPLTVWLDSSDGLRDRLAHLERKNERLEAEVARLRASIVEDIAEQFYRFVVPRVDSFLSLQREGLEGQMIALWRNLSGDAPPPIARRGLPESVSLRLSGAFTGYRWSLATVADAPSDRWFARSAFLGTEVSNAHDILVVLNGAHAASRAALDDLTLTANGRAIDLLRFAEEKGGWRAIGVIPRAALAANGALGLLLETDVESAHPLAPSDMDAVSLSVGSVVLRAVKATALEYSISASPEVFPSGWHAMEHMPDKRPFRWMTGEGSIVLSGLLPGAPIRVELSGPMALGDVLAGVTADLDGAPAEVTQNPPVGRGWSLKLKFPARDAGGPSVAVLRVRASARQPSAEDKRFLSLALTRVVVDQTPEPPPLLSGDARDEPAPVDSPGAVKELVEDLAGAPDGG